MVWEIHVQISFMRMDTNSVQVKMETVISAEGDCLTASNRRQSLGYRGVCRSRSASQWLQLPAAASLFNPGARNGKLRLPGLGVLIGPLA